MRIKLINPPLNIKSLQNIFNLDRAYKFYLTGSRDNSHLLMECANENREVIS